MIIFLFERARWRDEKARFDQFTKTKGRFNEVQTYQRTMYTESQEIISFFPRIYIYSSSIMLYTKLQTHTHSFASIFQYSLPKKFISFYMQRNTTQQVLYSKSRCPLFPVTTFRSSDRDPNSINIRIQVRIFKSRFRLTFSSDPTPSTPPPSFFF